MPNYYIYLVSSLPELLFGKEPPFSYDDFLKRCQGLVDENALDILRMILRINDCNYQGNQPTLLRWYLIERQLRNELVKIRAANKQIDPSKYLRIEEFVQPDIARVATIAYRNPSFLEAERLLDQKRWQVLDELAFGHYFDIDFLIIYGLKLLILERWKRINSADKMLLIEDVLKA